jgi:glycosyltransferase involved in cell wall biosynthesis
LRNLKAKRLNYDLLISAYNAVDLGGQGIQYIHWIKVVETGNPIYRKISDFSDERLRNNLAIANSYVVAHSIEKCYSVDSTVIYPPVVLKSKELPWDAKENAFICSGRLVPMKQPHQVIEVLEKVRQKGFDVRLYMTGGGGGTSEQKYERFLRKKIEANSSWITLYTNLTYEEYSQVLYRCKYGIHFKKEPFGISIAEMVKAGTIPFVKEQGGQVEIVGKENTDLLFNDQAEAVEKIVSILKDESKQQSLLKSLEKQKALFSTERFVQEISSFVDDYFKAREGTT